MRRRVAAIAIACAAFLGAAATARAASDAELLSTYEPVLVFDVHEAFRPSSVEPFIADSQLERRDASGAWVLSNPHPSAADVAAASGPGWRLNQRACSPALPLGGLACYAASDTSDAPVVYGRAVRQSGATVLQYWLFYYDDVYSYAYPPTDFVWQAHESDWEVVNVVLSADGRPLYAAYSQHCTGERRAWDRTQHADATHPVVYVTLGSHANEFAPGIHPVDPRCVPQPALDALRQAGFPPPADRVFPGDVAGTARSRGRAPLRVVPLDTVTAPWLSFAGTWGELQYFHASTFGTFPFGASPTGPAFHDVWQAPVTTLASWPETG